MVQVGQEKERPNTERRVARDKGKGGEEMNEVTSEAEHGASKTHRRGRSNVVLSIVMIAVTAAIVALMILAGTLMSSGSGAEDVNPNGSPCACNFDDAHIAS